MIYFGRTFEVKGTIIFPCDLCGTPLFPFKRHAAEDCIGLDQKLLDDMLGEP